MTAPDRGSDDPAAAATSPDHPAEAGPPRERSAERAFAPPPRRERAAESTRSITHGAIYAAILALLFLAGQFLPFAGIALALLCPAPVVLMRLSFGRRKETALTVLVAGALVAALTSPLRGLVFLLLVGVSGLALAECVAKGCGATGTVAMTAAAGALGSGVLLALTILLFDADAMRSILERQKRLLRESFDGQIAAMESRASKEEIARMREMTSALLEGMDKAARLMPAALYVSSLFSAALNFLACRLLLARFRIRLPGFPPFARWRAPRAVAWTLLAGYLAAPLAESPSLPFAAIGIAGLNLVFVAALFFLATGLATLHHTMGRAEMSRPLRAVTWVMVALNAPLALPLLVFAGLLEQAFDWRGLAREEEEAAA